MAVKESINLVIKYGIAKMAFEFVVRKAEL
jgi:hypothetical protein